MLAIIAFMPRSNDDTLSLATQGKCYEKAISETVVLIRLAIPVALRLCLNDLQAYSVIFNVSKRVEVKLNLRQ